MKHLILGGVRSGKSRFAERCARERGLPVTYVATADAQVADDEMAARIAQHQLYRPDHWQLIEETHDLAGVIRAQPSERVLLIDCLTLWLTNLLIDDEPALQTHKPALLGAIAESSANIILVSNEVGWGIIPTNDLARRFADEAGALHQSVAALCDEVTLVAAGLPLALKTGNSL